jgi:hypothetical protein
LDEDPVTRRLRGVVGIYSSEQNPYLRKDYEMSPWVGTSKDVLALGSREGDGQTPGTMGWPSTPQEMERHLRRIIPAMQREAQEFFDPGLDLWHEMMDIPFRKQSRGPYNDAYLHTEMWRKEGTCDELWILVALKEGWSPPDEEIEEAVWHYALTGQSGGTSSRFDTGDEDFGEEDQKYDFGAYDHGDDTA